MDKHHVQLKILESSENKAFYSKTFGLKDRSELLKIKDFNLCDGLLQDTMHTVIEGVCIKEIKCLFKYILDNTDLSLEKLNDLILSFQYCFTDKNDLPKEFENHHIYVNESSLRLTAGQLLVLIINLPLILNTYVKTDDEYWINFLKLHQIVNISFSFTYEDETIDIFKNMINKYIICFKNLYSDASITPKMHYLTHLPEQLKNYGPLRHSHCFRCEAKNGLIKGMDFKSFKNLSYSIVDHHQLWSTEKQRECKFKNSIAYNDDIYDVEIQLPMSDKFSLDLNAKKYVRKCSYLKKQGLQFKNGMCLILTNIDVGESLGIIDAILNVDEKIYFYLKEYKIKSIINHTNSLKVMETQNYFYKNYNELIYKNAQYCLDFNDYKIVQLRYLHFKII